MNSTAGYSIKRDGDGLTFGDRRLRALIKAGLYPHELISVTNLTKQRIKQIRDKLKLYGQHPPDTEPLKDVAMWVARGADGNEQVVTVKIDGRNNTLVGDPIRMGMMRLRAEAWGASEGVAVRLVQYRKVKELSTFLPEETMSDYEPAEKVEETVA